MLRWRLFLGFVFTALLVGLCWLDHRLTPPGLLLFPLAALVSLAGAQEVLGLLAEREARPRAVVVYGGTLLVLAGNAVGLWWPSLGSPLVGPLVGFGLAVSWAFGVEMFLYREPGGIMERLALGIFGVAYVPFLMTFVIQLRGTGEGQLGILAIASLLLVVKLADVGAYTVGRLIGRHKMAPRLSPGKTLEGAGGALVFSLAAAWLGCDLLLGWITSGESRTTPLGWLVYGLTVGAAGMAGDLAESLFKRDVGRKDSSRWMPGFGGVLDLLDSVLLAAPVAYLWWTIGLVG